MSKSVTMTVRVDTETRDQLETLAVFTKRTKTYLASEAVSNYVAREMAIMTAIEAGITDREANRVVPHDEAMNSIDKIIDQWRPNNS